MFKLLFCLFFIIHILADFYFQSDKLAEKKRVSYKYVLLHSVYYLLISIICILPFWSVSLLVAVFSLAVLHFVIDSAKFLYLKGREPSSAIYVADQFVHITCVALAAAIFTYMGYALTMLPVISDFLLTAVSNPMKIVGWAGLFIMALKPANITIKQLVTKYKPAKNDDEPSNNAGAFIGSLERIIIILLLSAEQYAAIGFVITAKSVARYNKISEDKQFAEYYLLGTLLSVLLAIITYFIFY